MAVQLTEHLLPTHDLEEEGELSGQETCPVTEDTDRLFSEEQNYRETVRGVLLFMGWHHIPEYDSGFSSVDDNSIAGSRTQQTSKISISCLPMNGCAGS